MKTIKVTDEASWSAAVRAAESVTQTSGNLEALTEKIDAAKAICDTVREFGDAAVSDFTEKFDRVKLDPGEFEVPYGEIKAALRSLDADLVKALERARDNILYFHQAHLRESWEERLDDGTVLGQRITPIERVGVYVPGGKAFYPSSVLMNIVPARVAGVKEIVMVSPPSFEGSIHPAVLAAAKLAGATRVFRIGGAQSIAALAYGTGVVPAVMKITGPGNTYVTAAKAIVRSVCEIDTEAGPSEVAVIADGGANPRYVAGELLAQAEHDEEACSVLITTSEALVPKVMNAIEEELKSLSRAEIIQASLASTGMVFVVRNEDEAAQISNLIAPEHLAIYTTNPRETLAKITNAGSIMVGEATTVVYGDYLAGPNHILPTGRRARFASPLTAEDFRKVSSIIQFTPDRAKRVAEDVMRLATAEELTAHARAAEMRR